MRLCELDDFVIHLAASEAGEVVCALASNSIFIFELGEESKTEADPDMKLCAAIAGAHEEIITGLDWAARQYGRLFATCSLDGSGSLWRESSNQYLGASSEAEGEDLDHTWIRVAHFAESQSGLLGVKFCSRAFGLRVAFCAEDGNVLVYSAADPGKFDEWLLEVLSVPYPPTAEEPLVAATCLDWTSMGSAEGDCPWLVVGGSDGLLRFWKREATAWTLMRSAEAATTWIADLQFCPSVGRHLSASRPTLAVAAKEIVSVWTLDVDCEDAVEAVVVEEVARYSPAVKAERVEWWPSGKVLSVGFEDGVFETVEVVFACTDSEESVQLLPMGEFLLTCGG